MSQFPSRLIRSERAIHAIGWIALVAGALYITWFLGWVLDYGVWWFAIPIALANVQGYIAVCCNLFSAWYQAAAPPPTASPRGTLDVFVATIDEPYEVLAPTVVAAVSISYPHRTYVLDDGRREWVRRLCEQTGAAWITRPDNSHAKAGNLNHALSVTSGEFIVTLDADFVAAPSIADDLLGHFADPKVALVQIPQVFYNVDSFQHFNDGSDWNEQSHFHDVVMPAKNYWNAVYWCGSPAILRRAALDAIGGVSTGSVTEDIKTSILLHRSGWRTLFDPRIRARGIAPEDYERFFRQRLRWTSGGLQLLRSQYWRKGLSVGQRLSYLSSSGLAFGAARAIVIYLIPPTLLLGGAFPVRPTPLGLAAIVLMAPAMVTASFAFGRGVYRIIRSEVFGVVGMAAYLTAYPVLFGMPAGFGVTRKGRVARGRKFPRSLTLLALLGVLYAVAIPVGVYRLATGNVETAYSTAFGFTLVWVTAMAVFLIACLTFALRHAGMAWKGLGGDWPARITLAGQPGDARVRRLALGTLELVTTGSANLGDPIELQLASPEVHLTGVVTGIRPESGQQLVAVDLDEPPLALARYVAERVIADAPRSSGRDLALPPTANAVHDSAHLG